MLTEARRLGGIVDDAWLIHSWGGEYTVLQMTNLEVMGCGYGHRCGL